MKDKTYLVESLLSTQQAQFYIQQVHSLREYWLPHGKDPAYPYFHTLGLPIYLNNPEYDLRSKQLNPILIRKFEPVYSLIMDYLRSIVNEPVIFCQKGSIPGFHIYGLPMFNGGSIHFDQQNEIYARLYPDQWDLGRLYSVTLCLDLPPSGGGINFWNCSLPEFVRKKFLSTSDVTSHSKKEHLEYDIGCVYVFPSQILHQIAPNPEMKSGELRMTMQGHLLRHSDGYWIFYW